MWWHTLGLIHCALGKRALMLVLRVDGAGQPVLGSFDRHSCLEGPQLHFHADKNCDQCFDWEVEEEGKFEARGAERENVIAWLASVLKFKLARFVSVWMPCVVRMV